jgi:predicted HicB family RNase H-like nuclease
MTDRGGAMISEHKMTIRIPKELHKAAKVKAAQVDRPLSAVVRELLEKWLEEDPPKSEEKEP